MGFGEHHPTYAELLKGLGTMHGARREYEAALPHLTRALGVFRENLDLAAAIQSERQQLRMAEEYRDTLDRYLSLSLATGAPARESWAQVLAWKGSVFARQRRLRTLKQRPDLAPLFAQLATVCRRLAAGATEAPEPKGREERLRRVETLTAQKEEIERKLAGLSAEVNHDRGLALTTPLEVQAALPEGAVLVDFLEYAHWRANPPEAVAATRDEPPKKRTYSFEKERRLLAFAVRRERPVARLDLGSSKSIEEAVEAWRGAIEVNGAGKPVQDTAEVLRRRILEPLASHLAGARVLLVSPDGAIARFPLAALPGESRGTYLIEELAVGVVPFPVAVSGLRDEEHSSLTRKEGDRKAPPGPPSLLVVGDVEYEGEPGKPLLVVSPGPRAPRGGRLVRFEPLHFTRAEADSVKDAFLMAYPGAEVSDLRGTSATEEAFAESASGRRYLHLATHGFFAPPELRSVLSPRSAEGASGSAGGRTPAAASWDPALLSGIALAGANRKEAVDASDGILTALELAPLDLEETEIMVLSACETGLGAVASGEGLLGLQRAAQIAGARTVVASLWMVDDDDTRRFMGLFYENLWRKRLPKIECLRQAQLAFIRRSPGLAGDARGPGKEKRTGKTSPSASPRAWAAWTLSGDWR